MARLLAALILLVLVATPAFAQTPQQAPHVDPHRLGWLDRVDHGATRLTDPPSVYIILEPGQRLDRDAIAERVRQLACRDRPGDLGLPVQVEILEWRAALQAEPNVPPSVGETVRGTARYPVYVVPPVVVTRCGPET